MTTEIPTNEPFKVVAGDRVQWTRSLSDYPASAGWALAYYLVHRTNSKITINASADGDDHSVNVAPATTTNWTAGRYKWQAFATKDSDRFLVDEGELEVETNFASGSVTTLDDRSHARKVLDAIEAVLENRATKDQESYSISGRTLSRTPIADLLKLRNFYRGEVRREIQAERIKNGMDSGSKIYVRFSRP